ncbi:MAG: transporter substrate-binding domain-containing protein [Verrucomicrobia bacterium]|nr:transporter substrate-binding domain-containing protein [Verrucomicrobiota bacterium]
MALGALAHSAEPLRVALAGEEPFVVEGPPFSGVAVDVWEKIAAANSWTFQYTFFPTVDDGIQAVASGKVDVLAGNVGITKDRLSHVEFSQPFFRSGFQIMVPEARPHSVARLGEDLLDIAKMQVFWYVAGTVIALTVFVFLFERRHNPDFPKQRREGLAEAFYYVISLALTGKSTYKGFPGVLGRLVMVAWMILGIITVAYVTSSITSSMTLEKLGGRISGPQDLPGKTVAIVSGSTAAHYLQEKGITIFPAGDLASAVDAMMQHKADAVVDDAPVLQSYDFNHPELPITEVGPVFAPQNYGFALAIGSPLRIPLNQALLDLGESRTLAGIFHEYFGSIYQP